MIPKTSKDNLLESRLLTDNENKQELGGKLNSIILYNKKIQI